MKQTVAWTDEQIETLRKLWGDGKSTREISAEIGGECTRSAVIGKAHRLGLAARITPRQTEARRERARRVARRTMLKQFTATSPAVAKAVAAAGGKDAWVEQHLSKPAMPKPPMMSEVVNPLPAPDLPPLVASVLDLESHHCRWIPGEPSGGFCGRQKVIGLPYCECHALRAFDFTKPRSRRDVRITGQAAGFNKAEVAKHQAVEEFMA